ncbi:hypothetical protein ACVIHD_006583 [Bradyrhizobium embrapense]
MIPKSGYRFSDQIMRESERRMILDMTDGGVPRSRKA